MEKIHGRYPLPAIGFAVLLTLACSVLNNIATNNQAQCEKDGGIWQSETRPDGTKEEWCQEVVYNSEHDCNSARAVKVQQYVIKDEVNEFNTRLCTFSVTLTTVNPTVDTWIMGLIHEADVWSGTESFRWSVLIVAEANAVTTYELSGYLDVYNTKDAAGPSLLDIERFTAIPDTSDCADLRFDEEYLDSVSRVIPATCPE